VTNTESDPVKKPPANLGKLILKRGDPDLKLKLQKFSLLLEKQLRHYKITHYVLANVEEGDKLTIIALPAAANTAPNEDNRKIVQTVEASTAATDIADTLQRVVNKHQQKGPRSITSGLAPSSGGVGFRRGR